MPLRAINTGTGTSTTTVSVVVPATAQVDDFATIILASTTAPTTDPTSVGWTAKGNTPTTASAGRIYIYTKTIVSGDIGATVTVTLGASARSSIACMVRYGVAALEVDPPAFSTSTSNTTSPTAPGLTVGTTGVELCSVYGCLTNTSGVTNTTFTVASGQTKIADITTTSATLRNATFAIGEETLSASGATGTRVGTSSNTVQHGSVSLAYTTSVAPTANAGSDQTVSADATVTLDGTGSTANAGTITAYAWTQISGTAVTLSSSSASQPTFTAPHAGVTLVFGLIVSNSGGRDSTQDTVSITVDPPPPEVKVRSSGSWLTKRIKARVAGAWV